MMQKKSSIVAGVAAFAAMSLASGTALANPDYLSMTPAELAEYLTLGPNGFDLEQAVQEGGVARARMEQDSLQAACSVMGGGNPDAATLAAISAEARGTIKYPEGGIQLGDWQRGRTLAWSGFGYRVAHNPDNHERSQVGGNCYNCHQMATDRTGGTLGPSLTGYGKTRGTSDAILTYAYDMIYNPHAYFPCTNMPRMGYVGVLGEQQMMDILAYLFDPNSPVNE
jgi:sulfur-oxidizing protein SoxX